MQIKKSRVICIILILISTLVLTINGISEEDNPPYWNDEWEYFQELEIPISTESHYAIFQPIDIRIDFDNSCWVKNENEHSIRVLCWNGEKWYELESQIYRLTRTDPYHISSCGLIFLIPEFANGKEQYYLYYSRNEKPSPNYLDHIVIEDAYYYYEPISGISVEGDYYKIKEDNYIVYAVGQKGKVMNRRLSQCVIKMRENTEEFGIMNSDLISSFAFSYYVGVEDNNEISSDQKLLSKEIRIDGNLMTEFGIISESLNKELRTTNIYKYYYCPTENKRISINVRHEVLKEGLVKGIVNVDGRYGTIISFKSESAVIKKMCFGNLLPYLHVFGENNIIKEYRINLNPETEEREWIISYLDDCDIGKDAWISYDEGQKGKTHGIVFASNKNIIKNGKDERDGFEIKVSEREYLNILGTEIDYASIAFGRNSYEKGKSHDVNIPDDLKVEFYSEFITFKEGNSFDVAEEGKIFRELVRYRYDIKDDFEGDQEIYTLLVIPHMSGRILSYPYLVDKTNISLPVIWLELFQNKTLIKSGIANKPFIGLQAKRFPKLSPGEYIVKVYRKIGDFSKKYIGIASVKIEEDLAVHIYCTWQKKIEVTAHDQYQNDIENLEIVIYKDNTIVVSNVTYIKKSTLNVPFNIFDSFSISGGNISRFRLRNFPFNISRPYSIKAFYKGFNIYDDKISLLQNSVDINLSLYDLIIEVKDFLELPLEIDVKPFLTSSDMYYPQEIIPYYDGNGKYNFEKLPPAKYELHMSFGPFSDKKTIIIPENRDSVDIKFNAEFDLFVELYNSRGEYLYDENIKIKIIRNNEKIHEYLNTGEKIHLPPGEYIINVFFGDKLIASKDIDMSNDRTIKIITSIESIISIIITGTIIIFIGEIVVLFLFRKIALNTCLKLIAMALIILSLFHPWWFFNGTSNDLSVSENNFMYIVPQIMIDSVIYEGRLYLDIATIPEVFTDFLGVLLIIIISGLVLMGISFIPNIILRKRFSIILISASILFLIIVGSAFSLGMSRITDISLGDLQGEDFLDITIYTGETINMKSIWGFGIGYYIFISSTAILVFAGLIDFIRKKGFIKVPSINR